MSGVEDVQDDVEIYCIDDEDVEEGHDVDDSTFRKCGWPEINPRSNRVSICIY